MTKPEPSELTLRLLFLPPLSLKKSLKNSWKGEPSGTRGEAGPAPSSFTFCEVEILTTASRRPAARSATEAGPADTPGTAGAAGVVPEGGTGAGAAGGGGATGISFGAGTPGAATADCARASWTPLSNGPAMRIVLASRAKERLKVGRMVEAIKFPRIEREVLNMNIRRIDEGRNHLFANFPRDLPTVLSHPLAARAAPKSGPCVWKNSLSVGQLAAGAAGAEGAASAGAPGTGVPGKPPALLK